MGPADGIGLDKEALAMYCPACAAPIDGMRYCRACGANVSLVPQALSGQLPATPPTPASDQGGRVGRADLPSVESISKNLFSGVGMFLVSLLVWRFFPGGSIWWFWLLIPAFASIGQGLGKYWQLRREEERPFGRRVERPTAVAPQTPVSLFEPGQGSVTEQTTRRLGMSDPPREEP